MKKGLMLIMAMAVISGVKAQQKYSDLCIFDLKGRVKLCVWKNPIPLGIVGEVFKNTVNFNSDGTAVWPKEFQNQGAFDKKGVLRYPEHYEVREIFNSDIRWNLDWNSSGNRISQLEKVDYMEGATFSFSYDEKGRVVKCDEYWDENGDSPVRQYAYRYLNFDAKGNWIKRECTKTSSSGSEKSIETRTIVYY